MHDAPWAALCLVCSLWWGRVRSQLGPNDCVDNVTVSINEVIISVPSGTVCIEWFSPERVVVSNERTLEIMNIQRSASGIYTCVATHPLSKATMNSTVNVTVQFPCETLQSTTNIIIVNLTSTAMGSNATYQCRDGSSDVYTTQCTSDGVWKPDPNSNLDCRAPVSCETLQSTTDIIVNLTSTTMGSNATYQCRDGSSDVYTTQCTSDGVWEPNPNSTLDCTTTVIMTAAVLLTGVIISAVVTVGVVVVTECSLQMKDDSDMNDNGACSTTSDMTANPAYGTTSEVMANISHNTTANPWICERNESIVMHKNPTYATATETVRLN